MVSRRLDVLRPDRRFGSAWLKRRFRHPFGSSEPIERDYAASFRVLDSTLASCRAVLSLGGDNYTLDYGRPEVFFALNRHVRAAGLPVVIWGASVGPFDGDSDYVESCARRLRDVDLILAREDQTVEYLASIGVRENVRRVSDPAFLMPAVRPPEETLSGLDLGDCIGLNLSPLFAGFTASGSDWLRTSVEILRQLVRSSGSKVLLVPHVILPGSNDWDFMRRVQEMSGLAAEVQLLPAGLSAQELKWVIGQTKAFAGCRMHSTIAALSMGVPTVSLSYSAKSFGLTREFFDHTDYLVPAGQISGGAVLDVVMTVLGDEQRIRAQVRERLPLVEKRAVEAARVVLSNWFGVW